MPESPKKERADGEKLAEDAEINEESSPSKEPQKKSYYYDDAHGYEIYDPKDDLEEDTD